MPKDNSSAEDRDLVVQVQRHFNSSAAALIDVGNTYASLIVDVARRIAGSLKAGGKLLTCGNGGSAADAEHIAAEFVGRFRRERGSLPAVALTSCTSALTAIANDYGFDQIFARQIQSLGNRGDILLAISTSGTSPNVLAGIVEARSRGLFVVALTGSRPYAPIARDADAVFAVPSSVTAEIQQCHISIAHAICELVDGVIAG